MWGDAMNERTDPHDWGEMWAWIGKEWILVRKVEDEIEGTMTVETYEFPERLYGVVLEDLRRGEKPTEPPSLMGFPRP